MPKSFSAQKKKIDYSIGRYCILHKVSSMQFHALKYQIKEMKSPCFLNET